jgi:phosphonate transport system ATP-binding protein
MEILSEINRENGITVLVSLHQVEIALQYCPRLVALSNGHVVYNGASSALTESDLKKIYNGVDLREAEAPPSIPLPASTGTEGTIEPDTTWKGGSKPGTGRISSWAARMAARMEESA